MTRYASAKFFLALCFALFLFGTGFSKSNNQQTKILLRTIGHAFLLQINDSTSRVLPIEKKDEKYVIRFQTEFALAPDELMMVTYQVLEKFSVSDGFIVEVNTCNSDTVVHSFEANLPQYNKMMPCKGRMLPKDCYTFSFTHVGNIENVQTEKVATSNSSLPLIILASLALVVFGYYLRLKRSKTKAELISIGEYFFDKKGMKLIYHTQSTDLSSKESDLLYLLYCNEDKTLERDFILHAVWGDDGNYVGRTLDVFVSKLRKKLESDASLKIVNIRGVGYRFVIN